LWAIKGKRRAIKREAHAAITGVVYFSVPDDTKLFEIDFAAAFGLHDSPWWASSSSFMPPLFFRGTQVRSNQLFSAMSVFDAVSRTCGVIRKIGKQLSQELGKPLQLNWPRSTPMCCTCSKISPNEAPTRGCCASLFPRARDSSLRCSRRVPRVRGWL
jgi:hypothetical protein